MEKYKFVQLATMISNELYAIQFFPRILKVTFYFHNREGLNSISLSIYIVLFNIFYIGDIYTHCPIHRFINLWMELNFSFSGTGIPLNSCPLIGKS
jgi:hypothetical protein